jgi:hypothetical protein
MFIESQDRQDGPAHLPAVTANMGEQHEALAEEPAQAQPIEQERQLEDRDQERRRLSVRLARLALNQIMC